MRLQIAALSRQRRMWPVVALAVLAGIAAVAAELGFPFDQEFLLDTAPLRGSKRVPGIEIQSDGWASIDLWCASGRGRVQVEGAAISIVPHSMTPAPCPPERSERDADILSVLTQVTTWKREGDTLVLIGPQTLRYRLSTH